MGRRFNILSLSGGGFLGLYTIAVLEALEKECSAPLVSKFDLVAGTSIGGIIALGLAAGKSAKEIKLAFEENGERIFSSRPAASGKIGAMVDISRFLFSAKYRAGHLRETISELIGARTLIGDLHHRVMVPAINLSKGKPQVFKTPHHQTFVRDLHLRVVDVALATSAAPTYFPIAHIGDELFADGGLYANSPDILAVHEAMHFLQQPIDDIYVLSVGTTTSKFSLSHAQGRDFGLFSWAKNQRLMKTTIASQQMSVDYMMGHRLGSRYLRLDEHQSAEQEQDLALDVATKSAQRTIRALAKGTIQQHMPKASLQDFLAHTAAPPRFYR